MEQLKIGDKVKILWEKTDYVVDEYYLNEGVIVEIKGQKNGDAYFVSGFNKLRDKYTLNFTKEQLVKVPEITKPLEQRDFAQDKVEYALQGMFLGRRGNKILLHHSLKDLLGNMEKIVLEYTLPTKVVFDINKRKTTLLFGDKPYEHKVSGIAHKSDKFDTASGFFIQLAKHIVNDKWQDKMQMWEYLSNGDFETVKMMIFNFVLTHLKEELGMSFRQLDKLSKWNYTKPLTFEINGIKHTIEVEHKLEKLNYDEIPF